MEPKYTQMSAIISFDDYPSKSNLLVSVQEAWFAMTEAHDFLDPFSGELSIPIETDSGEVVYIYSMRAMENREILLVSDNGFTFEDEEE